MCRIIFVLLTLLGSSSAQAEYWNAPRQCYGYGCETQNTDEVQAPRIEVPTPTNPEGTGLSPNRGLPCQFSLQCGVGSACIKGPYDILGVCR